MTDDKTKRDFRDNDRINRDEEYEVQYWRKELAVSGAFDPPQPGG
jgi:hypothetical protein